MKIFVLLRNWRLLVEDESAAVAVEFGIIVIPFIVTITLIFGIAFDFGMSRAVEEAAQQAARLALVEWRGSPRAFNEFFAEKANVRFLDKSAFVLSVKNITGVSPGEGAKVCSRGLAIVMPEVTTGSSLNAGDLLAVSASYTVPWLVPFKFPNLDIIEGNGQLMRAFCAGTIGRVE